VLREIEMKKPALMMYTGGSIMGCETRSFEGRFEIEKDERRQKSQ
jgi:hypothetical protein